MSADNGVYILHTLKDNKRRVVHAQAIENIDFFPMGSKEWKQELISYFGDSKVFDNEDDAFKEAKRIYEDTIRDCHVCEYGIQMIELDAEFPK